MQSTETIPSSQKSWVARKEDIEDRQWWVVDAANQRVGRVATVVATLLRGKHKPTFTPHTDMGDFVVVINTDKLQLTGGKWDTKKYFRHSRFFGSLKEKTAAQYKEEDSTFIFSEAVLGMLPDNKLSYAFLKKLKTFTGPEHTHTAQKPQPFTLKKHVGRKPSKRMTSGSSKATPQSAAAAKPAAVAKG